MDYVALLSVVAGLLEKVVGYIRTGKEIAAIEKSGKPIPQALLDKEAKDREEAIALMKSLP